LTADEMSNHKDVNPSEIAKRDDAVKNMATHCHPELHQSIQVS
jgi:hypothetical protein